MTLVRVFAAVSLLIHAITIQPPHAQITPQLIEAAKKEGEVVVYGS